MTLRNMVNLLYVVHIFGLMNNFASEKRYKDISLNVSLQPVATVKLTTAKENDIRSPSTFLVRKNTHQNQSSIYDRRSKSASNDEDR